MKSGGEVVFAFFEAANFGAVESVIRRLERDGEFEPFFLKGFDFKEHVGEIPAFIVPSDLPHASIDDWIPHDAASASAEHALGRASAGESLAARAVRGVLGRSIIPDLFARVKNVARGFEAFLAARRPRLVVIPEDTDYIRGRLAAHLARAHGVRSVVCSPIYYGMFADYPLVGERIADVYLALNDVHAERLRQAGVDSGRIHVVGSPAFGEPQAAPRAADHPRLLFALQNKPWELDIVRELAGIVEREDVELIVKQHPRSPNSAIDAAESLGVKVRIVREGSAHSLLPKVQGVIAHSSRVLYEAALAGLPIVVVSYDPSPPALLMRAATLAPRLARDADSLAACVRSLLSGTLPPIDPLELAPHVAEASVERIVRQIERCAHQAP